MIYERLHELNILLNKRATRTKGERIKFFYMLKDDSFVSKDRSKIFDFIIPIIPVVGVNNSYQMVVNSFQDIKKKVSDAFLRKLSVYIDDMRLLLNIANEFQIYYERLNNNSELNDPAKLLGLITYKNVFPKDFAHLQEGTGFVKCVVEDASTLIQEHVDELNKQKEQLSAKLSATDKTELNEVEELESLYLDFTRVQSIGNKSINDFPNSLAMVKAYHMTPNQINESVGYGYGGKSVSNQLTDLSKDTKYLVRKQLILNRNQKQQVSWTEQIRELNVQIAQTRSATLSELLKQKSNSYFKAIAEKNNCLFIINSRYFSLLPFLFREGAIDEHYYDYIEYFYPGELSQGDKKFLRMTFDNIPVSNSYQLDNPHEVVNYLDVGDISRYQVTNVDFTVYLLSEHKQAWLSDFFNLIRNNNNINFVQTMLSHLKTNSQELISELLNGVLDAWPDFITNFSKFVTETSEDSYSEMVINLLQHTRDEVLTSESWEPMKQWVNRNAKILFTQMDANQIDKVFERLKLLGCKFNHISNLSKDEIEFLIERDLVTINEDVIDTLQSNFTEDKPKKKKNVISSLKKSPMEWLNLFAENHELNILEYLLKNEDDYVEDEEEVSNLMNLEKTTDELKIQILKKWTAAFSNIKLVENIDDRLMSVKYQKMKTNSDNILVYIRNNNYHYSDDLTPLINAEEEPIRFSSSLKTDEQKKIFAAFVNSQGINDKQFAAILESLNRIYNAAIPVQLKQRIPLLVKHGIVKVTLECVQSAKKFDFANIGYFAMQDISSFLSFVNELNLTDEEKISLITSEILTDKVRAQIIEWSKLSIDLTQYNFGNISLKAILKNGVQKSNVSYLVDRLRQEENSEMHDIIWNAISKYPVEVNSALTSSWDDEIARLYLNSKIIGEVERRRFFVQHLDKMSAQVIFNLIEALHYPNEFKNALTGKTEQIENNTNNLELFNAFLANKLLDKQSSVGENIIQLKGNKLRIVQK